MSKDCVRETYVDGIGKIHFIGGMIRFDMYSFDPDTVNKENEKPEPVVAERLIMSPNGFLASYDAMVNMIKKLEDAGVIQQRNSSNDSDVVSSAMTIENTK